MRKVRWEQRLACGCVVAGEPMRAKNFYQIFLPYGPKTAECPQHGLQRVVKRTEIAAV